MNQTSPRLDLNRVTPDAFAALNKLAADSADEAVPVGLDPLLLELVRLRASQINACQSCLDLHTRNAREQGETQERLQALARWRDSRLFTDCERAALRLTESVTLVHADHVPDDVYALAQEQFNEAQLAYLLWTVAVINAYNRLAIATAPGG
jgi:AhpD family alkylhydroperoxidase